MAFLGYCFTFIQQYVHIYILGHSSPEIKRNYILHEEHKVHYFFSNENEILLHCKSILRENVLDFYENNVKTLNFLHAK